MTFSEFLATFLPGQPYWTISVLLALMTPCLLWWLARQSVKESLKSHGQRRVAYTGTMKYLVRAAWALVVVLPALAAAGGLVVGTESLILMACLIAAGVLPVQLEVRGLGIGWDGYWLYTQSVWRRSRRIPVNSVTRCGYSRLLQSYRLHTTKNGIVTVPVFTKGIPDLLALLSVTTPPYPPALLRGGARQTET
ncbi:MAG: hypothetical protein EOP86_17880 [Verrucomicrobiaceae bacterium]|nr:MAG: hypothetical protein EOP86_17880 [Verrucomicrobiaceae bacterium]